MKLFKRKPKPNPEISQSSDSATGTEPTTAAASTTSLPEPIGLRVVHEPTTGTRILSIVFVHGLGGSARETWTHLPSKTFWPTLLHEDDRFANARISTFGYDANFKNIFAAKSVLGIPDFAKQLLDALDLQCDKYGDTPTIFVAHSMGGLIVKKAVIDAHNDRSYTTVLKNAKAMVFLGTPHRGADLAGLLSKLLFVTFSKRIFVDQLHANSELIQGINNQFRDRTESLELVSFYESKEMRGLGIIVPKDSATLGFPGEKNSALNGNHLEIVKFSSKEDDNYQRVAGNISKLVKIVGLPPNNQEAETINIFYQNWLVPYERNPRFTGRKTFLETLRTKLLDQDPKQFSHRIALYGMGGIGKTQIALAYVYANKTNYDRIYWIPAVTQASLFLGYQKIADNVGLKIAPDSGPIDMVKTVLGWLRREQNWLLVIDNLDIIEIVDGFLPENGPQRHTLITTRNPNATGIPAEGLEVPLLESDDAIKLLSTLSNVAIAPDSSERRDADEIVQRLGNLPLAIEQAAAYIREATENLSTFLEHYDKSSKDLHKWVPKGNRQYPFSVATTWSMSFNIVRETDPQAARLFQLFSFLNPDGILIDFLESSVQVLEQDLRQVLSNPIDRAKALIGLEKFSLIKWDRQGKSVVIHRLVQSVIRDEMSEEDRRTLSNTVVQICDESFPKAWNNNTRPVCRIYFGQVLMPLLRTRTVQTMKLADIMTRVSDFLSNDGNYNDSAKLLKEVVEIRVALRGADDPSTLTSMNNLALTYGQQGKMTESAKMHKEVLTKSKMILGEDHPHTLTGMNNLAEMYQQQGKMTESTKMHEKVLTKRKLILGEDHPDTLTSMNNLAATYRQQGKITEAAKMYEEALAKRKLILGEDHPDTLTSMNNLAVIYLEQGKITEAEKMYEEALAKRKLILDEDHPSTLMSMNHLAEMYRQQGKIIEAAKMHEEVLAKRKMILGEDHPDTLMSMHNLAEMYRRQGKMTEATKMHETMLAIAQGNLGDDDLPPGWERRNTDAGRPYYADHNTQTTTWVIPPAARALRASLPKE